jgi:hypothetical protein
VDEEGLAVLGRDDAGETALRDSWALVAGPGGVTFTANGTNASKATAARFTKPGSYTLRVTITSGRVPSGPSTVRPHAGTGRSTAAAVARRMDRVMTRASVAPR